jgi:hypothetical protein
MQSGATYSAESLAGSAYVPYATWIIMTSEASKP